MQHVGIIRAFCAWGDRKIAGLRFARGDQTQTDIMVWLKKPTAKNLKSNGIIKSQYRNVTNFLVFCMTFLGLLSLYIKNLKVSFTKILFFVIK